jgi:hypothetical protein
MVRDAVIERHHGAVRMITKEIKKGRHGAGLEMMDAGRLEKRKRDGVDVSTSIPDWLFPADTPQEEKDKLKRKLKPDILLLTRDGDRQRQNKRAERGTVVRLVEVKYCKDTDRTGQQEKAEVQHEELKRILEEAGHEVKQHTILLGVGGTVYKETPEDLEALGVARLRARRLMERLSNYAVGKMQTIVQMKRARETEVLQKSGSTVRWEPRKDRWEPKWEKKKSRSGVG